MTAFPWQDIVRVVPTDLIINGFKQWRVELACGHSRHYDQQVPYWHPILCSDCLNLKLKEAVK